MSQSRNVSRVITYVPLLVILAFAGFAALAWHLQSSGGVRHRCARFPSGSDWEAECRAQEKMDAGRPRAPRLHAW